MKNIIKINEDFEMYRDKHQWILWHWTDGETKDGDPKRQKRETYHGSLEQVCSVIRITRASVQCNY